jgi:hypothetical protein
LLFASAISFFWPSENNCMLDLQSCFIYHIKLFCRRSGADKTKAVMSGAYIIFVICEQESG